MLLWWRLLHNTGYSPYSGANGTNYAEHEAQLFCRGGGDWRRVLNVEGIVGGGSGVGGCEVIKNLQIAQVPVDPNETDIKNGIQKMPSQGGRLFMASTALKEM
jgi:hypothetical protein